MRPSLRRPIVRERFTPTRWETRVGGPAWARQGFASPLRALDPPRALPRRQHSPEQRGHDNATTTPNVCVSAAAAHDLTGRRRLQTRVRQRSFESSSPKHKQFDPFDDRSGYLLASRHLDRRLSLLKLRIRNERKSGIGAQPGSLGERTQTGGRGLHYVTMLDQCKSMGFKDLDGLLNGRELLADLFGRRPEATQRRKPIELIAKGSSHKNVAARRHNPVKLARAGMMIANVMPHMRQPYEVTALASQRDVLGRPPRVRKVLQSCTTVCHCEHGFRRLYAHDLRLECLGE
jgi:hypothetical protein